MRGGLNKPAQHQAGRVEHHTSKPKIGTQLRAKVTPRHDQVKHFGNPIRSTNHNYAPKSSKSPLRGEVIPAGDSGFSQATAAPLPSMITSVSHQKLERLLDEALTKADSHKQALRYHAARHFWQKHWFAGPRRWGIFACLLIVTAAAILFMWQRSPQFSMKIAGLRAHLSASTPTYKPDGFSLASPAKAQSGTVVIKYKSSENPGRTYTITQAQSNLTSTLVSQNIVPKGTSVQTSQVNGNTVYIYGGANDAAWVNNNVLYTIKDQAKLSSDQLINIVRGLNP